MYEPDDKTCAGVLLGGMFAGGLVCLLMGALNGYLSYLACGSAILAFWGLANYRYIPRGKRCDRDVVGRLLAAGGRKLHTLTGNSSGRRPPTDG